MRKMVVVSALALVPINVAGAASTTCERADPTTRFSGPDLSLTDLERIGYTLAASDPDAPQVPFAKAHKDWLWFKAQHRPGDRILAFEGPRGHDGLPFAQGYALLRGHCVVGLLTTRRA